MSMENPHQNQSLFPLLPSVQTAHAIAGSEAQPGQNAEVIPRSLRSSGEIDELLAHPIVLPLFTPLTREEVYDRT